MGSFTRKEILRDENVRKMLSKNIDSIAIEEKYGTAISDI